MVCIPKEEGGLGVINLQKQNEALLLKNQDKFFNKKDIPWMSLVWEKHYPNGKLPNHSKKGSYWWKDILKLLECYKSFSAVQIQNGQSCFFWMDKWNQQPMLSENPELYSFAKRRSISVCMMFNQQHLEDQFSLPLSTEAFEQLQLVQSFINHFPLTEQNDSWKSNWGNFSISKTYKFLIGRRHVHQVYKWL